MGVLTTHQLSYFEYTQMLEALSAQQPTTMDT
jgi:hypothetical protein